MSHPFGELLKGYRQRKRGLSQERLAHMIGYDQAVLVRMSQGKKDLTGPSGRDRVVSLIEALRQENALHTLDEANKLLAAATLPPLYDGLPLERALIRVLLPSNKQDQAASALTAQRTIWRFNLPAPVASFIGRTSEIEDVVHMLKTARLVTLTGAGGSGKTRLALEAGQRCAETFSNGVCWMALAPVRHADDVLPAFAQLLRIHEVQGTPLIELVKQFLANKSLLLLLDNFEHVLDSAPLVTEILMAAPNVSVLATSREPLRLSGEQVYAVEPLALESAVELFVQRARALAPRFQLTDQVEPTVRDICRRMDCLPLAIELAATRVQQMSPEALLAAINQQRGLGLLTDAPRDAPSRHRTLHNTIAWSYGLLSQDEQRLLRTLGVFVGGAEIEQIAFIGDWQLEDEQMSLHADLQSLVDKSLARAVAQADGTVRYLLLELIREFALAQAELSGEMALMQRSHAQGYLGLAREGMWAIRSHQQLYWHERFERDYPNFREALTWSFGEYGDVLLGCQLVEALTYFWFVATRYMSEMRAWIVRAYAVQPSVVPPSLRAGVCACLIMNGYVFPFAEWIVAGREALMNFSEINDVRGIAIAKYGIGSGLLGVNPHDEEGLSTLNKCLSLCRDEDNAWLRSHALQALVLHCMDTGDMPRAESVNYEMVEACRKAGNIVEESVALWQFGDLLTRMQRFDEANEHLHEATRLARQMDSPQDIVRAQCLLASNMRAMGDLESAIQVIEACITLAHDQLPLSDLVQPLIVRSKVEAELGHYKNAEALRGEAMQIMRQLDWPARAYLELLSSCAVAATLQGNMASAVRLWGVADVSWSNTMTTHLPQDTWEYAPYLAKTRAALGEAAYEAAYAEGRAMPLEQAIEYALQSQA
jgi:predicted ATPase